MSEVTEAIPAISMDVGLGSILNEINIDPTKVAQVMRGMGISKAEIADTNTIFDNSWLGGNSFQSRCWGHFEIPNKVFVHLGVVVKERLHSAEDNFNQTPPTTLCDQIAKSLGMVLTHELAHQSQFVSDPQRFQSQDTETEMKMEKIESRVIKLGKLTIVAAGLVGFGIMAERRLPKLVASLSSIWKSHYFKNHPIEQEAEEIVERFDGTLVMQVDLNLSALTNNYERTTT